MNTIFTDFRNLFLRSLPVHILLFAAILYSGQLMNLNAPPNPAVAVITAIAVLGSFSVCLIVQAVLFMRRYLNRTIASDPMKVSLAMALAEGILLTIAFLLFRSRIAATAWPAYLLNIIEPGLSEFSVLSVILLIFSGAVQTYALIFLSVCAGACFRSHRYIASFGAMVLVSALLYVLPGRPAMSHIAIAICRNIILAVIMYYSALQIVQRKQLAV